MMRAIIKLRKMPAKSLKQVLQDFYARMLSSGVTTFNENDIIDYVLEEFYKDKAIITFSRRNKILTEFEKLSVNFIPYPPLP